MGYYIDNPSVPPGYLPREVETPAARLRRMLQQAQMGGTDPGAKMTNAPTPPGLNEVGGGFGDRLRRGIRQYGDPIAAGLSGLDPRGGGLSGLLGSAAEAYGNVRGFQSGQEQDQESRAERIRQHIRQDAQDKLNTERIGSEIEMNRAHAVDYGRGPASPVPPDPSAVALRDAQSKEAMARAALLDRQRTNPRLFQTQRDAAAPVDERADYETKQMGRLRRPDLLTGETLSVPEAMRQAGEEYDAAHGQLGPTAGSFGGGMAPAPTPGRPQTAVPRMAADDTSARAASSTSAPAAPADASSSHLTPERRALLKQGFRGPDGTVYPPMTDVEIDAALRAKYGGP